MVFRDSEEQGSRDTDRLIAKAYDELRRLARGYLHRERIGHTLQPTALVNEAYLHLLHQKRTEWRNREHFVGIAARLMRRILREHARGRNAAKRGGGNPALMLEDPEQLSGSGVVQFLEIERALEGLSQLDPPAARVVELRFFGGLTIDETSELLDLSPMTVKRHWTAARAYLYQQLRDQQQ